MSVRRALACFCMVAIGSMACQQGMPTAPSSGPLSIVAYSPAAGQVLSRGATVSVSLTVASESPGVLTLSVQDQAGTRLLAPEPSFELQAGKETAVRASFEVPALASSIDVLASFRSTGGSATPTVIHVGYVAR